MSIAKSIAVVFVLAYGLQAHAQQPEASARPVQTRPTTSVSFVAINVSDIDKSVAFYKLVGFNITMQVGAKPNRSAVFQLGAGNSGGGLILVEHEGAIEQGSALSRIGVRTPDAAALCKRLAGGGTPCTREPRVVPQDNNTIIGLAKDPDGNSLELLQLP